MGKRTRVWREPAPYSPRGRMLRGRRYAGSSSRGAGRVAAANTRTLAFAHPRRGDHRRARTEASAEVHGHAARVCSRRRQPVDRAAFPASGGASQAGALTALGAILAPADAPGLLRQSAPRVVHQAAVFSATTAATPPVLPLSASMRAASRSDGLRTPVSMCPTYPCETPNAVANSACVRLSPLRIEAISMPRILANCEYVARGHPNGFGKDSLTAP